MNNAGIGQSGPVELASSENLKRIFDINLFGQLAMIRAFLPLLRRKRGRIVNVGSVGARLAIPFGGALCASKAAFEIFSDSLRLELGAEGIHVAIIQPGAMRTPAVDKTLGGADQEIARWPEVMRSRYGAMFRAFTAKAAARENNGSDPMVVAACHPSCTLPRRADRRSATAPGQDSSICSRSCRACCTEPMRGRAPNQAASPEDFLSDIETSRLVLRLLPPDELDAAARPARRLRRSRRSPTSRVQALATDPDYGPWSVAAAVAQAVAAGDRPHPLPQPA